MINHEFVNNHANENLHLTQLTKRLATFICQAQESSMWFEAKTDYSKSILFQGYCRYYDILDLDKRISWMNLDVWRTKVDNDEKSSKKISSLKEFLHFRSNILEKRTRIMHISFHMIFWVELKGQLGEIHKGRPAKLECVENTDCSVGRSCVNNKCVDACRWITDFSKIFLIESWF